MIDHSIPRFAARWDLSSCPTVRILFGAPTSCGLSIPRAAMEQQRRSAQLAETQALAEAPNAHAIDLIDDLCSPATCSTNRDGVWIYRDRANLSVEGARAVTPRLFEVLQPLLSR